MTHEHTWIERMRDDNENRIRTCDQCDCGALRYGCLAKRLADDGAEAWGPVGKQYYRVLDPCARCGKPVDSLFEAVAFGVRCFEVGPADEPPAPVHARCAPELLR